MSKFKGKNSIQSTARLAIERAKYNREAFPENDSLGPEQVVDFNFAERTLYGRVNRQLTPVIVNQDYLKAVTTFNARQANMLLMNFVVDQIEDFESHFVRACRLGLIPRDDDYLSSIKVQKAYVNPITLYQQHVDKVMLAFFTDYLPKFEKDVFDIGRFIHYLLQFLQLVGEEFPLTLSGFQKSNQSSIYSSGLCFNVADLPFDDDELKQEAFLDNPAFNYYINLAKQYGFSVNKRSPNVLISDLASPVTAKYRQKYELFTLDLIFANQYQFAYSRDLELLSSNIISYYNRFVNENPTKRFLETCGPRTKSFYKRRTTINNINNNIIINLYVSLRNIEERQPFGDSTLQFIANNAVKLSKHSADSAIVYIDDQFRSQYNQKVGSLNYYAKIFEKRLDRKL